MWAAIPIWRTTESVLGLAAELKKDRNDEKLLSDPAEKENIERFKGLLAAYMGYQNKVIALVNEQKNWEVPAMLKSPRVHGLRQAVRRERGCVDPP